MSKMKYKNAQKLGKVFGLKLVCLIKSAVFVLVATALHLSITLSYAQETKGTTEITKIVASLMEQAYADGKKGNTEGVIAGLSKVIEIDSRNGEAHYERGAGHYVLGENYEAIEDYSKAITLEYKVSEAMSNRGMVYIVIGNFDEAKKDLDMSIELQPSAPGYSNRAAYYIKLKDYRSAIQDGRQAILLDARNANTYFNVASAYVGLGDTQNGVEYLEKACDLGYQRACDILRQRFGR